MNRELSGDIRESDSLIRVGTAWASRGYLDFNFIAVDAAMGIPQLPRNNGRVFSGMVLPAMVNFSQVNTVLQNVVQRTSGIGTSSRPIAGSTDPRLALDPFLIEPGFQLRDMRPAPLLTVSIFRLLCGSHHRLSVRQVRLLHFSFTGKPKTRLISRASCVSLPQSRETHLRARYSA